MLEVIHAYTRNQAIEDGFLIDVSDVATQAGFRFPVALTRATYEDCVAWSEDDQKRKKVINDASGRLWDVLTCLHYAIKVSSVENVIKFPVHRVPRSGASRRPERVVLYAIVGPGDHGEPVITIQLNENDD